MVVRAVAHCVSYVQTLFNQGRSEKGGSRTGVEFRRTHVACVFTRDGTRINTVTGTIFLPREVATMWVDSTTSAPYAAWDSRFTFHAAPPPLQRFGEASGGHERTCWHHIALVKPRGPLPTARLSHLALYVGHQAHVLG